MKRNYMDTWLCFILCMCLAMIMVNASNGYGKKVSEDEAVAVGDLWYAMELNSGHVKMEKKEKKAKLEKINNRIVKYLVSKDELLDRAPRGMDVLAYVITYDPSGFVVVTGDDRLDAVVVFDATSEFSWEDPERNFLRYFLGTEMVAVTECIDEEVNNGGYVEVHPHWITLKEKVKEGKNLDEASFEDIGVYVAAAYELHPTASWDQCGFYNDTVAANNGNNNCIPTGCVATAMAIKMRYHAWPGSGSGGSHTDTDNSGTITGTHSVNFNNETYNWGAMPTTNLTAANADVADLMYQCGVAVDMDYELGCCGTGLGSAANTMEIGSALVDHMRYRGCANVESNTISDHEGNVRRSILGGLPANLGGHGHSIVADGYRDTQSPFFHINAGWGGSCNAWYNLSNVVNDPTTCGGRAITVSVSCCSPNNYVYADGVNRIFPDGTLRNAYETFNQGYQNVPSEGQLWLKGGSYQVARDYVLSYPMVIKSYEGEATIQTP